MAWVQIAVATLSGNSLRQTVHTHRASVHQATKLVAVAALLRVAAAYRQVYDSRQRRLTAKNREQLRNPTLGSRVCVSFTFYFFYRRTLVHCT